MLHTQTLTSYLDALASSQPTPGGGAAAAVTAAQGVALLSMVCRLTLGKKKFADQENAIAAMLATFEQQRQNFLTLAHKDAEAFQAVMAAYKLPKATAIELAIRTEVIQTALEASAEVPLTLFRACGKMLPLADSLEQTGNPAVLSDVLVGRYLLFASLLSAHANVEANLASITDRKFCQEKREVMNPILALYQAVFTSVVI